MGLEPAFYTSLCVCVCVCVCVVFYLPQITLTWLRCSSTLNH